MGWKHWLALPLVLAGCSFDEPATSTKTSAVMSANALTTNALASNGVWENGVWENGVWENGVWENGVWENGVWENGVWENGVWENGVWENGVWENGVWENGVWENNLAAANLIQTNPYTGRVLQYIYSCAMPAGVSKTLTVGSTSIQLEGAIGLAPTWDTPGGTCDETCQRWISACVLARTNAYGVRVEISMRAPDDAPDQIKRALALATGEADAYPLREGAFYGNIFATKPPPEGTSGAVQNAPAFFACAGPGSNIPELTKRFNSSQGVGGPIINTGLCEPEAGRVGACAGFDETTGAVKKCDAPATDLLPATQYKEVITVWIKKPASICGNGVCELDEQTSCPSDCHPGTWTRAFDQVPDPRFNPAGSKYLPISGLSALSSQDQSVVVVGETDSSTSLDLGGPEPLTGTGSHSDLVLAKYSSTGAYQWALRYTPFTRVIPGSIAIDKDGNIAVVGVMIEFPNQIWIGKFDPNGNMISGWPRVLGGTAQVQISGYVGMKSMGGITFDASGNLLVAGSYQGVATFKKLPTSDAADTITIESINWQAQGTTCCGALDIFVVKLSPDGAVLWAHSLGEDGFSDQLGSLNVDAAGNVLVTTQQHFGWLYKLGAAAGDLAWSHMIPDGDSASVADPATGDVYVTGGLRGFTLPFDFGDGVGRVAIGGIEIYLAKYSAGGALQWVKQMPSNKTAFSGSHGAYLSLGPDGLVIGGAMGGLNDLGAGRFDSYATSDLFLAGYSLGGDFQWAKHVSLVLDGHFWAMQVVGRRLAMSGWFSGSMYIDDRLLANAIPELTNYTNTFLASFNLPTLGDTTPPVVDNLSDPIVVQATSSAGAKVWFMAPTAIDTGYAGTSVICDPPPNSTFRVGVTWVTCTATDPFGNATVATFPITVNDIIGPDFVGVAPVTATATSATGAVVNYPLPTASDQISGTASVTCTPPPGSTFAIGTTTVTCTAVDSSGNRTTTTFPVTVTAPLDVTPPTFVGVSSTMTIDASSTGTATLPLISATDPNGATVTCNPPVGSTLPVGTTTVTCTATDSYGNTATTTFTVTVRDTTPPVLTAPTAPVVVSASGSGTPVTYATSATDSVDGAVTTTCTPPSGSTFAVGTTTVTCRATDAAGNQTTTSFQVRVQAQWSGILQPINADGSSAFKLGSVVPVKFQLTGASASITNLVATLTLTKLGSTATGTDSEAVSNASADTGNTFRYDATAGVYIFNLATKNLSVGDWQLNLSFGDGVSRTVKISLKK